jgi:predicted dinucleotide-binding enzyme
MSTAMIGTGGLGSVIARRLASGGESLRLSSADAESARTLAAAIGRGVAAASDNRDALQGADAVILALRFGVLKGVIEEIADSLTDKLVVVPSNPVGLDAQGQIVRLLPQWAILWQGCSWVAAGGGAPRHGVWQHVGRSPRVL